MNRSLKNAALGLALIFGMQSVSIEADISGYASRGIGIATALISPLCRGLAHQGLASSLSKEQMSYVDALVFVASPLLAGFIAKKTVAPSAKNRNPALMAAMCDASCATGISLGQSFLKSEDVASALLGGLITFMCKGFVANSFAEQANG